MNRLTSLGAVTAAFLTAAATAAVAQQQYPTPQPSAQQQYPETYPAPATQRPAPSAADSRALSTDLLTENEVQRFDEMRRAAKTPAERSRVEEQQRAMLNERVLQRTLAVQQPSSSGAATAERPAPVPQPRPSPMPESGSGSGVSDPGGGRD